MEDGQEPKLGTPETLQEAIRRGLCLGPLSEVHVQVKHHVRDYLAQHFAPAYLKAGNDEELGRLQELWERITGEKRSNP